MAVLLDIYVCSVYVCIYIYIHISFSYKYWYLSYLSLVFLYVYMVIFFLSEYVYCIHIWWHIYTQIFYKRSLIVYKLYIIYIYIISYKRCVIIIFVINVCNKLQLNILTYFNCSMCNVCSMFKGLKKYIYIQHIDIHIDKFISIILTVKCPVCKYM